MGTGTQAPSLHNTGSLWHLEQKTPCKPPPPPGGREVTVGGCVGVRGTAMVLREENEPCPERGRGGGAPSPGGDPGGPAPAASAPSRCRASLSWTSPSACPHCYHPGRGHQYLCLATCSFLRTSHPNHSFSSQQPHNPPKTWRRPRSQPDPGHGCQEKGGSQRTAIRPSMVQPLPPCPCQHPQLQ